MVCTQHTVWSGVPVIRLFEMRSEAWCRGLPNRKLRAAWRVMHMQRTRLEDW